ncbi:hypothetical protein [Roseimicrobium sp. ORNL1]|uniref:hypothetical protein n=1 Tax=Roseimicrobium sp. ORNL1 TaxID=2711231 RepID=UPI0013E1F886|nr:hypothetical protein [Roseimicrobium sp. ORNL1]QIF05010.1 hypothetical protein G5S37_27025 [Roseimicrobium sp. ORNL1]
MTLASQLRLCRAGIVIGVLFCVAAVFEVTIGLLGMFRDFDGMSGEELQDPSGLSQVVGEALIVIVVRLWPLPLGLLALLPSLIWRHRLRRRMDAALAP